MPATAERIGFILQPFRTVVAVTAQAATRHGNLARQSEDPVETFFDNAGDAQVIATERQALLSPERRRFKVNCNSAEEALGLSYNGQVPAGRYVDTERGADRAVLVAGIIIDLDKGTSIFEVWG